MSTSSTGSAQTLVIALFWFPYEFLKVLPFSSKIKTLCNILLCSTLIG